ncbi:unnamed protein product [Penicillium pancosmium]
MQPMQKNENDEEIVGVSDLDRWPIGLAAVRFLAVVGAAESTQSLEEVVLARRVMAAGQVEERPVGKATIVRIYGCPP